MNNEVEVIDAKKKEYFRNLLTSLQNDIVAEKTEDIQVGVDNIADIADRASQEEEITVELQNITRKHALSNSIGIALQKLEENVYGLCEKCDTNISIKRLEVDPVARLCIDCQEFAEIKQHNYDL